MNKFIFTAFIILFNILYIYPEKENTQPSWVYLKRAENYKEKGEYGKAFLEARKSRDVYIEEKIKIYYEEIRDKYRNKIEYELLTMTKDKRKELLENDDYPKYHELMGDLFVLTGQLDDAEKEYKKCLSQSKFFDYPQKKIEIKYKLADIFDRRMEYELEDITYREIVGDFFAKKKNDFWDRIRLNIKGDESTGVKSDPSLSKVFKIYRLDGMEYLKALYKIGRRAAILQRSDEALYYLSIAAIVWMTYYSELIKKNEYDFQYADPSSFINYISKKKLFEYESEEYYMDLIFFYIGYVNKLKKEDKIKDYYFNLAVIFSKNTDRTNELQNLIEYLQKDKDYLLTYNELMY
jgi:hypothetical protein